MASRSLLHAELAKGELLSREDERSHSGIGGLFVHCRDALLRSMPEDWRVIYPAK